MTLYKNKYRTESLRLKGWDYSWNGYYFITICTKNRKHFFGDIVDGKMVLSTTGSHAEKYLQKIPQQFPNVKLDEFIVMPNHVHCILQISTPCTPFSCGNCGGAINRASTVATMESGTGGGITGHKNPMFHNNISRFIRWYKGRVTFESRKQNPDFAWQSLFYDRIIRDEEELFNVRNYIKNNSFEGEL